MIPVFWIILLSLACSHVMADFLLQTDWMAANKRRFSIILGHSWLHGTLAWLLCGAWLLWVVPAVVFVTHAAIDVGKSYWRHKTLGLFLVDQGAHAGILIVLAWRLSLNPPSLFWLDFGGTFTVKALILGTGVLLCIHGGGVFVGHLVQPMLDELKDASAKVSQPVARGLADGGRWIGRLERTLIFLLVIVGQPAGIGFLITAKSILRFSEIKDQQSRMETEYIIIGTLASFAWGILVSYVTKHLLSLV
jgi:hypothetical protein